MRGHFAALFVMLALASLLAGCSGSDLLAAYLEANRGKLDQPFATQEQATEFVVAPGSTARTVSQALADGGLIADARLFEAYVRVNGLAQRLQAGTFTLSPHLTIPQIAEALLHARPPEWVLRVREGWRLEQIADYLDMSTDLDGTDYKRRATTGDLTGLDASAYDFLSLRPAGATLEGFLYPDTYRLKRDGTTSLDLLQRQLDRFAGEVMPAWRAAQAAGQTRLTLHQVLTLASIIEREAALDDERPVIARVYLNRLAQGMRLQADPTVQYGMGYQPDSGLWWKTPVYLDEYDGVDSPYNTYKVEGLPPGPICSPSSKSIGAVLEPADHDYLYFVAKPDGSGRHVFSKTFEEHLRNVREYQQGGN
jgi:UPF0755 protein